MKTTYLAGPMTGYKDWNFPAFFAAEKQLVSEGIEVVNPARHDMETGGAVLNDAGDIVTTDTFDLRAALLWDLDAVAHADGIYMLNGWENSKGAKAEFALAQALGKEILYQPTPPLLIGLGGKLASGKDEVADALVRAHGYTKIGMSDVLHQAMLALDPWVEYYRDDEPERYSEFVARHGYVEAKKYPEVRSLLQKLGTEMGRQLLGESVWVDATEKRIRELWREGKKVVVTGIRYPNEVDLIHRLSGDSVWVSRPGHGSTGSHASETSVSAEDFDEVVVNDGTLEDLYQKARDLVKI